jgi:RNA polymerase sigma factor (sigma-70 family)
MAPEIPAAGAFADWVGPSLPALHRYAARLVGASHADDLVQEALLRAWRRRSTYDSERGEPLPWLLAIVHDRARRNRRSRRDQLPLESSDGVSELRAVDLDLERALAELPTRQRQAIDLYYFVDLDVAAVAAVMGCAPGTVRATLHQARAALRDLLGEDSD